MLTYFMTMLRARRGQGMTEYALIIGLVAVLLIAVLTTFRTELGALFTRITGDITRTRP